MAGLSRHLVAAASQPLSRAGLVRPRTYGSSAALLCDDNYYDCYSDDEEQQGTLTMLGTERMVPRRGLQWVIMGDRGAKKHFFAEQLSKLLDVPHISTGSLVRQELNPRSSLYKQIVNAVNESKLVPQHVIFALLSKRLEEGYNRGETGFILEGAPRTMIQAEILDQIADIDLVLNLKCKDECTSLDKATLSRNNLRPHDEQVISSDLSWKQRFAYYQEQSKLVEDYYRKQKKLMNFQVANSPGESWNGLLAALHLQHMNVLKSSSQKLTA